MELDEAAKVMEEKSIPQQIIADLGYGSFDNIVLTDAQITDIISRLQEKTDTNKNCTKDQKKTKNSSMVAFVSGHGNDLDVATRHTIVDAVLGLEFSFPELNDDGTEIKYKTGKQKDNIKIKNTSYLDILVPAAYKTEAAFRKAFETYIEKNVYLQMAMGEPGPSAPMSMAENENPLTKAIKICQSPGVCTKPFSSSEVDIYIVENAYKLLQDYLKRPSPPLPPPPTDCELIEFNKVIRHILRANFVEMWDENLGDQKTPDLQWKKHYLKLLKKTKKNIDIPAKYRPEIWVLKRISKSSDDRYYQLKPNEDEEPEYRVHEGLHIFDLRGENGEEVPGVVDFNDWKNLLIKEPPENPQDKNETLDTNNLKTPAFKDKFFEYVKQKFPTTGVDISKNRAIRRAIRGILYSIEKEELYLSEICLLGFLLGIIMLTLYDPACRPLTHTITDKKTGKEILSTTRSGKVRTDVDSVFSFLDSLKTQDSQPGK